VVQARTRSRSCVAGNIALVIADTPRWPTHVAVTSDLVYLRFHGPERLYASEYSDDALREWAERVKGWRAEGRDVFAYFNQRRDGLRAEERAPPAGARVILNVAHETSDCVLRLLVMRGVALRALAASPVEVVRCPNSFA